MSGKNDNNSSIINSSKGKKEITDLTVASDIPVHSDNEDKKGYQGYGFDNSSNKKFEKTGNAAIDEALEFLSKINFTNTSNLQVNNKYQFIIGFKTAGKGNRTITLKEAFKYLNNPEVESLKMVNESKAKSLIAVIKDLKTLEGISNLTPIQKMNMIKIVSKSHNIKIQ